LPPPCTARAPPVGSRGLRPLVITHRRLRPLVITPAGVALRGGGGGASVAGGGGDGGGGAGPSVRVHLAR